MNVAKAGLHAVTDHVTKADVEVAEGFQPAGVLEGAGVDGVEADGFCQFQRRGLRCFVIGRSESCHAHWPSDMNVASSRRGIGTTVTASVSTFTWVTGMVRNAFRSTVARPQRWSTDGA